MPSSLTSLHYMLQDCRENGGILFHWMMRNNGKDSPQRRHFHCGNVDTAGFGISWLEAAGTVKSGAQSVQ